MARVGAIYTSDAARHDVAVKMIKVADELGDHDGKVRALATRATLHTRFERKIYCDASWSYNYRGLIEPTWQVSKEDLRALFRSKT